MNFPRQRDRKHLQGGEISVIQSLSVHGYGGYLDGDCGIPDKEDDDRGDDKDQEQHSDTKRLLLVGSIKLVLYNVTGKNKLLERENFRPGYILHNSESEILQHLPEVLCVVEGCLVVSQCLIWIWILGLLC